MKVEIYRDSTTVGETTGVLRVLDENDFVVYACYTLELPWLENRHQISCIPTGTYQVVKHVSPHFGHCFHVLDVPGRSQILIHPGNYKRDTKGCILVGDNIIDIDNDRVPDVTNSKATLAYLLKILPEKFELKIT